MAHMYEGLDTQIDLKTVEQKMQKEDHKHQCRPVPRGGSGVRLNPPFQIEF